MRKRFKLLTLLMALLLAFALLAGCGGSGDASDELEEILEEAAAFIGARANELPDWWGDLHVALIESEEAEDFEGFEDLQAVLNGFAHASGFDYIYALYPTNPDVPVVAPWMLTVDGSFEAGPFGEEYDWEEGFTAAWEGDVAVADYLWITDDGWYALSAYAPVYDSAGEVVAIIGIDYPVPDDVAEANDDWIWIE